MMYLYQYIHIRNSRYVWTVGYFNRGGQWIAKSDHKMQEEAQKEVERLNKKGG